MVFFTGDRASRLPEGASSVFRKYGYVSACDVGAGPCARPPRMAANVPLRYVTVFVKRCT